MFWVYIKTINRRPTPKRCFPTRHMAECYISHKVQIWQNFWNTHNIYWQYIIQ